MKSMTKVLLSGLLGTLVGALVAFPAMAQALELINYAPSHVFTPVGFDSNDNAQIVLAGTFPNTCYKVSEPKVSIDQLNKRVYVQDRAVYHKGMCLYMLVPYYKPVNLGVLSQGDYEIMLGDEADPSAAVKTAVLSVAKAPSDSADDYLYAPVEEATVKNENGVVSLTLKGTFTRTCYKMKEVKLNVTVQPDNMIIVQPIAEEDGTTCTDGSREFETTVEIPNAPTGKTLMHIRILNGQSINRVLNL